MNSARSSPGISASRRSARTILQLSQQPRRHKPPIPVPSTAARIFAAPAAEDDHRRDGVSNMDQSAFDELAGWVTEAGLIGRTDSELMAGFCRRIVDAGIPLARAMVILDTLHPIYEGRVFRWRADLPDAVEAVDYGRTNEGEAAESWRRSPFYYLLQSGGRDMRRRLTAGDAADFPAIIQARDEGMTDYLALVHRFAAEGVIGEMDCVYSSWSTDAAGGFDEAAIDALKRLAPFLK